MAAEPALPVTARKETRRSLTAVSDRTTSFTADSEAAEEEIPTPPEAEADIPAAERPPTTSTRREAAHPSTRRPLTSTTSPTWALRTDGCPSSFANRRVPPVTTVRTARRILKWPARREKPALREAFRQTSANCSYSLRKRSPTATSRAGRGRPSRSASPIRSLRGFPTPRTTRPDTSNESSFGPFPKPEITSLRRPERNEAEAAEVAEPS